MSLVNLPTDIERALSSVHALLSDCHFPWRVFGSCALALHGVRGIDVRDIDILISPADAQSLLRAYGFRNEGGEGTALFRSEIFIRCRDDACDVEIMSDMKVCVDGRWRPFAFYTQESVRVGECDIPVPSLNELKQSLRLFGRAKDLARLKLIEDQN